MAGDEFLFVKSDGMDITISLMAPADQVVGSRNFSVLVTFSSELPNHYEPLDVIIRAFRSSEGAEPQGMNAIVVPISLGRGLYTPKRLLNSFLNQICNVVADLGEQR